MVSGLFVFKRSSGGEFTAKSPTLCGAGGDELSKWNALSPEIVTGLNKVAGSAGGEAGLTRCLRHSPAAQLIQACQLDGTFT
jgi:hypothetical protein